MARHKLASIALLCAVTATMPFLLAGSPGPGEKAPALTTTQWLNNTGPMSWDQMMGKVILVEKWATW